MAQSVEQLIRNQQVAGSSPASSSKKSVEVTLRFFLSMFFRCIRKKNAQGVHFLLELITGFEPVTSSFRHKPPCIVSLCRKGKGVPFTSGLFLFPKKRKLKLISFFREPYFLGKASTTASKFIYNNKKKNAQGVHFLLELITGFEPVTSSLPRMRSTC